MICGFKECLICLAGRSRPFRQQPAPHPSPLLPPADPVLATVLRDLKAWTL